MIEVASAGHSHACAIPILSAGHYPSCAESLDGSEDDDGGADSHPASSHGSYSDPEFMGPNAQWKCIFWKS